MRRKLFVSAIALLVIFYFSASAFAQIQKDLEYFAGSWRGEFEMGDSGTVVHEIEFTWDSLHKYLKMSDAQKASNGEVQSHDGFFGIIQQTGKIHYHLASSAGEITWMSEISREGDSILFEGSGVGHPWLKKFRVNIDRSSPDAFVWTMLMPEGESWNQLVSITYKKVESVEEPEVPPAAQVDYSAARAELEFLAGTWSGTYEFGGMKVTELNTYAWDPSGTYLTVTVDLGMGGMKDTGYGFMAIDPETGGLRSHMIAGVGMVHIMREVERNGTTYKIDGKTIGMPMMASFEITAERLSEDSFSYSSAMGEGDQKMEYVAIYHRVKNTTEEK